MVVCVCLAVSGLSGCYVLLLGLMLYYVLDLSVSPSLPEVLFFFPFQIECMVAAEIMQRYKKLQFERGRWPAVYPPLNPTTEGG